MMSEEQARAVQASLYAITGELVRVEEILVAALEVTKAPSQASSSLGPDE
jgi:hypothetical protein